MASAFTLEVGCLMNVFYVCALLCVCVRVNVLWRGHDLCGFPFFCCLDLVVSHLQNFSTGCMFSFMLELVFTWLFLFAFLIAWEVCCSAEMLKGSLLKGYSVALWASIKHRFSLRLACREIRDYFIWKEIRILWRGAEEVGC